MLFDCRDVLDYVKTGMASIIEDEVTQRFVAEELKSWNLMTRTNSQFEFINWKLTFLWLAGGFIRYFVLLPARLTILVIGVSLMLVSCIGLSWVPHTRLRNWLYERVALTVFRCFSRTFSACIKFHNRENRPNTDGELQNIICRHPKIEIMFPQVFVLLTTPLLLMWSFSQWTGPMLWWVSLTLDSWDSSRRVCHAALRTSGSRGQRPRTDWRWPGD